MEQFYSIGMILVMIAIFYFLMIRPEQKRKKEAAEMRNSLKKGDMITSIGGIVGRVVMVTDNDTIIIETSEDRVRMELTKWAVSSTGVQTSDQPETKKEKKEDKKEEKKEEPAKIEEKASDAENPFEDEKK